VGEASLGRDITRGREHRRITPALSLALSVVSRREWLGEQLDAGAETPSITRLEGSRWHGGRLWSYKPGSTAAGVRDSDGVR